MDLSDVSFLQKGEGKDLVFFHGYLSNKEAFVSQVEYFSRFFRVTAFDFLGFGHSRALTKPFSVSDYAEWTKEVLTLLNVRKPHVIAHSFGCRVAVKMAAKEDVFDKMVLTGPAGIILPRSWKYHLKVKAYRLVKKIAPRFAEKKFGSAEYKTLSPLMKESYKKIVNEDLREDAKRIKSEVLLVQGAEDFVTTEAEARTYLQSFPRGRLTYIEGGHFAFAEDPVAFNLSVEDFLYD
ncbi:MAG: alpha/beta hydrolase [Clostridia bacterium]|nr:alpha/beta hydrolase [Clostridia bacterium]